MHYTNGDVHHGAEIFIDRGLEVPAVTTEKMIAVAPMAVEATDSHLLSMMKNAG
ncbi:hypothetical protein U2F10_25235 [Leptothoe sp. EHU-05/26/07-4]